MAVAARAGGVLIVARKNQSLLSDINAMAEQIVQSGAKVVGSVMVDF